MIATADAGAAPPDRYRLRYHGTGSGLFLLVFKNVLLTLVTLGIYMPWARTERRKYLWQNLEIEGHRLRYHGTGIELLRGYAVALLAYLVLFGGPALLSKIEPSLGAVLQLMSFGLLLLLIPVAIYSSRRYLLGRTSLRGIRFGLDEGALGYLGIFVGGYVLTIVTLGLYAPVWQNELYAYVTRRSRYGTLAFEYDGSSGQAWKLAVPRFLLTIVTLGLYFPWFAATMTRFRVDHTRIGGARASSTLGGADMFVLLLLSFAAMFTLGLAFPWVTTYAMNLVASRTSLAGHVDFETVGQTEVVGGAGGDAMADALDVGLGF